MSLSDKDKFCEWALSVLPKDTHPTSEQWNAIVERLSQYKCEKCGTSGSLVAAHIINGQHAEIVIDCKHCVEKEKRPFYAVQTSQTIKRRNWFKRLFRIK